MTWALAIRAIWLATKFTMWLLFLAIVGTAATGFRPFVIQTVFHFLPLAWLFFTSYTLIAVTSARYGK